MSRQVAVRIVFGVGPNMVLRTVLHSGVTNA
jgi:hypothetical protein